MMNRVKSSLSALVISFSCMKCIWLQKARLSPTTVPEQALVFESRVEKTLYTQYTIISCKKGAAATTVGLAPNTQQSCNRSALRLSNSLKGQPRLSKKACPLPTQPASQPATATASQSLSSSTDSSSCSLSVSKAKSLESLTNTKLSWPVRVQKTLYNMATCCVKCLGPV